MPLLIIAFKRDRNARYDGYKRFILRILFDAPLIITAISLSAPCGWHLFTPFASIIDDEVVQGTLPFACDVEELANEPYNVGAVVNMFRGTHTCRLMSGTAFSSNYAYPSRTRRRRTRRR